MRIEVVDDTQVLVHADGNGLEVTGGSFGALQMLAASLALCTASVLLQYAETARLHLHGLKIGVRWSYVDRPYRVGTYHVDLYLPDGLPEARQRALVRAAEACTVHNTLTHSPELRIGLADAPVPAAHAHHHDA